MPATIASRSPSTVSRSVLIARRGSARTRRAAFAALKGNEARRSSSSRRSSAGRGAGRGIHGFATPMFGLESKRMNADIRSTLATPSIMQ